MDLAILMGTDFNEGIKGIGPKKALTLIREYRDLDTVTDAKDYFIEESEEVRQIFLQPEVSDDYRLEWHEPDESGITDFLCDEFDFSNDRVASALKKINEGLLVREQSKLDRWF